MNEKQNKMSPRALELAFLEESLRELEEMSPEEKREVAIRAGILSDDGQLTKAYGGDVDPSDKYVPVDMSA